MLNVKPSYSSDLYVSNSSGSKSTSAGGDCCNIDLKLLTQRSVLLCCALLEQTQQTSGEHRGYITRPLLGSAVELHHRIIQGFGCSHLSVTLNQNIAHHMIVDVKCVNILVNLTWRVLVTIPHSFMVYPSHNFKWRTELLLAADEFLDGEFRVLHGEGSERHEAVREPSNRAPQVIVNQLRQVQGVRAFCLQIVNRFTGIEYSQSQVISRRIFSVVWMTFV